MKLDYRFQLTARRLNERFKSATLERHWDKIRSILKPGFHHIKVISGPDSAGRHHFAVRWWDADWQTMRAQHFNADLASARKYWENTHHD